MTTEGREKYIVQQLVTENERFRHEQEGDSVAVIDIGSNSIRLVVYRQDGHYPYPFFNERITCELGRGLDDTGLLSEQRIKSALAGLARFGKLIKALQPTNVKIAATAAVRRAKNAEQFLQPATEILGYPIDVLSASEEARLVTLGLTRNMYKINGLVADLGGGSIELILVKDSKVEHYISLNIGHLSNLPLKEIKNQINAVDWLKQAKGKTLYGIGGSFRAFGSAYIERAKYPLFLLHGLVIEAKDGQKLLRSITGKKPNLRGVPAGRQKTMSMAGEIIKNLHEISGVAEIFISGTSLRDGLMADMYPALDERHDQLLATGREIALRTQRVAGLNEALRDLMMPVATYFRQTGQATIDGKKRNLLRMVETACLLADICWNESPDRRAPLAIERILALPIYSITHKQRAWLALALYHRYAGMKKNKSETRSFARILNNQEKLSARAVGLGMRFAQIFCGGMPAYLRLIHLFVDEGHLVCTIPKNDAQLMDEHTVRRFKQFARSCRLSPKLTVTKPASLEQV